MTDNNPNWFDFNNALDQQMVSGFHDLQALRNGLLAQLERLLQTLFPQGYSRHGKFFIGNLAGDRGKSLVVELQGDKRGFWKDFATDEGGDVFALCAGSQQFTSTNDFLQLLKELQQWLGMDSTAPLPTPPRQPQPGVYLDERGAPTQQWHYLSDQGELLACVYRYDTPQGKLFCPWDVRARKYQAPTPRPLYHLPGIKQATQVVLVEGEQCAAALIKIGITTTTAMNGAQAPIAKTAWTPLAGKEVLIWPDNDPPGQAYAQRAAQAILAAQAASVAILTLPPNKPAGWDAADALAEDFDCRVFIQHGTRVLLQPPAAESDQILADNLSIPSIINTEDALTLLFTHHYQQEWRYVAAWGKWLLWEGQRWRIEETLAAADRVRHLCRQAALKAETPRLACKLAAASTMSSVERLIKSDRRHAATSDEWDADEWMLNTPGGVVDLQTGQLSPHNREYRMTKMATATLVPNSHCSNWLQFLCQVTGGNTEQINYLQRVFGYCLTGSTREQALFFLYGTGANGKSVFVNTLSTLVGDYAADLATL
ncbi:phage/plasmid primase, P4 family [unidentified bacterial endosymbiont]|uniref:phage/plasmid primase, P4 family n=1 Tax=unidentified bacterial endosymbiont TaxID=2355 RepID=UPI0020A0D8DA|nr:phage/plasmid primase, P4 family [unidentified bacterial endosymbiont]